MESFGTPWNETLSKSAELELLGGELCLDFANTVDRDRSGGTRHEFLSDYQSLVEWARHAGLLDDHTCAIILGRGSTDVVAAERVFTDALELRQAVEDVFTSVALGVNPAPTDLDTLKHHYLRSVQMTYLRERGSGFDWSAAGEPDHLDRMLWPITVSAVDLLRHGPLARVKRCPGDDGQCGWLFLDTTKNRSRRWCNMQTCGSRDKMRRLYQRAKQRESTSRQPS